MFLPPPCGEFHRLTKLGTNKDAAMSIYTREKSTTNSPVTFQQNWMSGSSPSYYNAVYVMPDDYMGGMNIPNFHARKRRGELLPHTDFLQRKLTSVSHSPAVVKCVRSSDNFTWQIINWAHYGFNHQPHIWHNADSSGAGHFVQQAAAEIYGQGFDASTSIAEMKQTAELVTGFNNTLNKLLGRMRKNRITPEDLHNAYLEGRYGWRILAYEAKDLYDAVANFDENRKLWTERRGYTYSEFDSGTDTNPGYGATYSTYGYYDVDWDVVTKHSIRGSVSALFEPSRFRINPVETAWELVKFSFVVDMVISVGDAIRAGSLLALAKGVTASIGVQSETQFVSSGRGFRTPTYSNLTRTVSNEHQYAWSILQQQRIPTSVPIQPTVHPHRYLSPLQALDMSALHRTKRILR